MSLVDNITFDILDEELNEIEYYEIGSFEEIIKINPTFIAFSREEIYNSLYNFFKERNKSNNFIELFYSIINKQKKNINTTNFIIVSDAFKKQLEDSDTEDFILSIKKLSKTQYNLSQSGKNKLWFILDYNKYTENVRFNAECKTEIKLKDPNNYYYVFKEDETNIPVTAICYQVPTSTISDYLGNQVLSKYDKPIMEPELKSEAYSSFEDLYNDYKIVLPLKKIAEEQYIDYSTLNNLLMKYNIQYDFINVSDLEKLIEFLTSLFAKEKEYKGINKNFKIKPLNIIDNKFTYFNILKNIKSLLEITIANNDNIEGTLTYLNEIKSVASTSIVYNNIYDIINTVELDLDTIIENLKIVKNNFIIDQAIKTLKEYNELDLETIIAEITKIEDSFNKLKLEFKDIYKISFDFAKEEHDIKVGNNTSKYEGGINSKIIDNFEDLPPEEDIYPLIFEANKQISNVKFDKYYNTNIYKNEEGLLEILKVLLPYLNNIQEKANLPIDYDNLCIKLFNKFREIPSKANIITNKFIDKGIPIDETYINNISKISPKNVFTLEANDINNIILGEANNIFQLNLYNSLNYALAFWSIEIQKEINNNTLLFNESNYYLDCISLWNFYGYPYNPKERNGVSYYLGCVAEDVFNEDDGNYLEIPKNYVEIIKKVAEEDFKEDLVELRKMKVEETKKTKDIGREYRKKLIASYNAKKFDKILEEYIDALLYMPADNYEKIHKYLLGCCLQTIDNNFKADTDIISKNRKDLIEVKKGFAKVREINKPVYAKFHPTKDIINEHKINLFKKISEEYNENIYKTTIEEWLENFKNYNLISSKILDELIKNPKNSLIYIERYINKLIATTGKKDLLQLYINYNFTNNYKNILLSTSKILYNHTDNIEFSNNINIFIKELLILTSVMNDDNKIEINRIIAFIISHVLCYPSNQENSLLTLVSDDNKSFIIANELYNNIIKIIKNKIPTLQDQIDFINKIREENKSKILEVINKLNDDERSIANELKKIGIKDEIKNSMDYDEIDEVVVEENEDDEDEGEMDFEIENEEQGETSEYNSDIRDYGFIYAD
jgi:hypothetical protein